MLLNILHKYFPRLRRGTSAISANHWDAAGHGRRLSHWGGTDASINSLLDANLDTLRRRSREVVMNNPIAANAIHSIVANCIGTGITPQSRASDDHFRNATQRLWHQWMVEADYYGLTDFYGLQAMICQSMLEGGSCFIRFHRVESMNVPLQLQVMEAEHLNRSLNERRSNGHVIKNGIEFNKEGKRVAYHLYRQHPSESISSEDSESVRLMATEVLHIFKPTRLGQIDGVPWLSNVLLKLHELDKYDDAELVRKQTAAMFAGFVTRLDPEDMVLPTSGNSEEELPPVELSPGMMQHLEPGENVSFSEPADVGGNYDSFMRQQLRFIAMGMGISYEQLTGDLTQVNYSSIRAGLLEFRRKCQMLQRNIIIHQLCRPVWQRWLQMALLANALPTPKHDTHYQDVKWIPQGWDWVDPLKDQKAQQMAVRNGFKSRTQVVSELGYDAEDMDQEIALDNQRADQLGVFYDSDLRHTHSTEKG